MNNVVNIEKIQYKRVTRNHRVRILRQDRLILTWPSLLQQLPIPITCGIKCAVLTVAGGAAAAAASGAGLADSSREGLVRGSAGGSGAPMNRLNVLNMPVECEAERAWPSCWAPEVDRSNRRRASFNPLAIWSVNPLLPGRSAILPSWPRGTRYSRYSRAHPRCGIHSRIHTHRGLGRSSLGTLATQNKTTCYGYGILFHLFHHLIW